jgi:hypothetical protein
MAARQEGWQDDRPVRRMKDGPPGRINNKMSGSQDRLYVCKMAARRTSEKMAAKQYEWQNFRGAGRTIRCHRAGRTIRWLPDRMDDKMSTRQDRRQDGCPAARRTRSPPSRADDKMAARPGGTDDKMAARSSIVRHPRHCPPEAVIPGGTTRWLGTAGGGGARLFHKFCMIHSV